MAEGIELVVVIAEACDDETTWAFRVAHEASAYDAHADIRAFAQESARQGLAQGMPMDLPISLRIVRETLRLDAAEGS